MNQVRTRQFARDRLFRWLLLGAIAFCAASVCRTGFGHETDQFSVPSGRQFADLRFWLSEYMYDRLENALNKSNARIRATLRDGQPTAATAKAQSLDTLAWNLLLEFPPVINYIEILESQLAGSKLRARYPGLVVSFLPPQWIYHHPMLVLDPTKLPRLRRSSTIMVNGTYFGTDKMAHFIHMGYLYFKTYQTSLAAGDSIEAAVKKAVNEGAGTGIFSENGLLGFIPTGVISNGDKVADYVGMKLFLNLTEPVTLKGASQPPLYVRDGELFRLNGHVRRNTDFFSVFISDHWNEALNPNTYAPGQEIWIREEVLKRCDDIVRWYHDECGRPLDQAAFRKIAEDLSTYYGEDYGHAGDLNTMVGVASTCFQNGMTPSALLRTQSAATAELDELGRTRLWLSARAGRLTDVENQSTGDSLNKADLDGETPLHAAVRGNHAAVVQFLLNRGASANSANKYGVTALHLAAFQDAPDLVKSLLKAGANPNAADQFGCTPLHDACKRGSTQVVEQLLQAGAGVRNKDRFGTTPLHRAMRAGNMDAARLLLAAGADGTGKNAFGHTAMDEARGAVTPQQAAILEQLIRESRHAAPGSQRGGAPVAAYPNDH